LSDHSSAVKGGVAFLQQQENGYERENYTIHGSVPMSPNSSMGVRYAYLQDHLPSGSKNRHRTHHQASIGVSYIIDPKTVLGLVVIDPTRTTPAEERAIA